MLRKAYSLFTVIQRGFEIAERRNAGLPSGLPVDRHKRSEGVLKPFLVPYQSEKGRCTALKMASRGKSEFRPV